MSGTLAEAKAMIGYLESQVAAHKLDCPECEIRRKCDERRELDAEIKQARADVRTWFAPGDDQEGLW